MIPIEPSSPKAGGTIRLLTPRQCYFKGTSNAQVHSRLFTFVDFGPGNIFLSACGVKHEPSVEEITNILLEDPRRFFELAEGKEKLVVHLPQLMFFPPDEFSATFQRSAILL